MGLGLIDGTYPVSILDLAQIGGITPNATRGVATGYVSTSSTSGVAIRATPYSPQGVGTQRSFKSTSASDTGAGIGAQQVTISYLDVNFVLHQEVVTLSGTTAVNTVGTDIAFIEAMQVTRVGTQGGGNVGTINIYTAAGGGGSIWGSIAASDNQTFWAHHYVPAGVTCYIFSAYGGSSVVAGQINFNRSGNPLTTTAPQYNVAGTFVHGSGGATADHEFQMPVPVMGPDFIWLAERPVALTSSTTFGTFEYLQF